jgi:hypothetical protein
LRIDIKDGRVRVICSANTWVAEWNAAGNNYRKEEHLIINCPPYTDKKIFGIKRERTMEAFIALIDKMHGTISSLEKSIKEGSLKVENEEW